MFVWSISNIYSIIPVQSFCHNAIFPCARSFNVSELLLFWYVCSLWSDVRHIQSYPLALLDGNNFHGVLPAFISQLCWGSEIIFCSQRQLNGKMQHSFLLSHSFGAIHLWSLVLPLLANLYLAFGSYVVLHSVMSLSSGVHTVSCKFKFLF